MADDRMFIIELPALPTPDSYVQQGEGQAAIALQAVTEMARAYWISQAHQRLAQRRRDFDDYKNSISDPQILPGMAVVTLGGKRANDLEFGRPSYDLRDVLLGPHVRVKRRGEQGSGAYRNKRGALYRFIPFAHQAPKGLGATGAPIGSQYGASMNDKERGDLARWVWKAAQQLRPSLERPGRQGVQWGERLPGNMAPKLKPHHTTSIYTSMYRVQKDYKNATTGRTKTDSKFVTFRTISWSVRRGWIVPATPGLHLLQRVQLHLAREAPAFLARLQKPAAGGAQPATPGAP